MATSIKELGVDKLDLKDRLKLMEEIWAGICAETSQFPQSKKQREELDRRIAEDNAFPDYVVPWDEVQAPTQGL